MMTDSNKDNIKDRIKADTELIDRSLTECFNVREDPDIKSLLDAQIYSLSSGGKRIRPILVLEISRLFGGSDTEALPLGCALEMVHTYSLIHDDLPCMDNDDFRRGKPTCHKVYGEAGAVLAGDALLTYAFETVARSKALSDASKVRAVGAISAAAGTFGMVGGQVMDLKGDTERLSLEALNKMVSLKTGKLICAAAELGCIAANVPDGDERMKKICAYADCVGLAFQITDDILDYESGTDPQTKTTFMKYYSTDEAKKLVEALSERAVGYISDYAGSEFLTQLALYLSKRLY